ncbi:LCP family protein [Brevibacterium otitidis]|uniref:LCP family protein n=1 Tax=Brevibacterium otitidis TaxID=53364 RepID=A0ABV5X1H1_9MICO|nr:hypothetical protein GCM10023233_18080 [Brevibacterium otitidis]
MAERRPLKYIDPVRYPNYADQPVRNARGWILLASTILVPGSVQSLFRVRRWAKFALTLTLIGWALILITAAAAIFARGFLISMGTNPFVLTGVTAFLAVYTLNWIICLLDTLRRVELVTLTPKVRRSFLAASLACALVIGGGLTWGTVMVNSQRQLMTEVFAAGWGQRAVDGRYNILLLGSDAGKGRTGVRPDSLSLISIDAKTGKAVSIGMPRNMQNVPFPEDSPLHQHYPQGFNCGDECLLNAIYQQGEEHADEFDGKIPAGVQATKDAAEGITGLEIQYYAMIDLKGFEQLIDAMGGIDLVSNKRVPISSKVDPNTGKHGPVKEWIEPGEQHLDGYHALWYARSREFASDYERMVRQRCVQQAMLKQLDASTVMLRFQDIAKAAPEVVSTDIPQLQVDTFVDLAVKSREHPLESLNLSPPEVNPTHPDFAAIHTLVAETIEASENEKDDEAAGVPAPAGAAVIGSGARSVPLAAPAEDESSAEGDAESICSVP